MKLQNDEKGFTLIELIVVIAIMGIVGAVVVPQFQVMSLRARMSADASTAQVLQNQVEIYYADTGIWPGSKDASGGEVAEPQAEDVLKVLVDDQCIDEKYLKGEGDNKEVRFQTDKAKLAYDKDNHRLYVEVPEESYKKLRKSDTEKKVWLAIPGKTPEESAQETE